MNNEIVYKILKIISNILFAFLGIVLVLCIYSFINLKILSSGYVNFFSYTFFEVGSNSMAPTITTDDILIVKLTDDVKENDIITFKDGDNFITHRLISIENSTYKTKGDANNTVDKNIAKKEVIGKVVKIIPSAGLWYKVITTPKIIFLICLTLFLFSIAFSYTAKKKLKDDDDFAIYYTGIELKNGDNHDR